MIYSFLSTALPLSFLSLLPTSTPASDLLLNPFIFFLVATTATKMLRSLKTHEQSKPCLDVHKVNVLPFLPPLPERKGPGGDVEEHRHVLS